MRMWTAGTRHWLLIGTILGSPVGGTADALWPTTSQRQDADAVQEKGGEGFEGCSADELGRLARDYLDRGRNNDADAVIARGLKRFPANATLWLMRLDLDLARAQYATALKHADQAEQKLGPVAELALRRARAYSELGCLAGQTVVRPAPRGKVGQLVDNWLLMETRGRGRFLCCPEESALYQIRLALDGGVNTPEASVLHAYLWSRLGQSGRALALLAAAEGRVLREATAETLAQAAEVALRGGDLEAYLRYERRRAEVDQAAAEQIMLGAYLAAADHYALRGDPTLYRAYLRRAVALRESDPDLWLRLADAEWTLGARERAGALYRRLLNNDPAHAERSRILQRLGEIMDDSGAGAGPNP